MSYRMGNFFSQLDSFLTDSSYNPDRTDYVITEFLLESKEDSTFNKVCAFYVQEKEGYSDDVFNRFTSKTNFGNKKHVRAVQDSLKDGTYVKYLDNLASPEGAVASEYFKFLLELPETKETVDEKREYLFKLIRENTGRFLTADKFKYLPFFTYFSLNGENWFSEYDQVSLIAVMKMLRVPSQHPFPEISKKLIGNLNKISPHFREFHIKSGSEIRSRFIALGKYIDDHLSFTQFREIDIAYVVEETFLIYFVVSRSGVVMGKSLTGTQDYSKELSSSGYTAHRCFKADDIQKLAATEENPNDSLRNYADWCAISDQSLYKGYTEGGRGLFIIFLRKDYKNWEVGSYRPEEKHEYENSMLAVAFGSSGNMLTSTSRMNNTDHYLDQEGVEDLTGISFSDLNVFRDADDSLGLYEILPGGVLKTANVKNIKYAVIPNTIVEIAHYAFGRCLLLAKVRIPDSVRTIGGLVFKGCEKLEQVKLPEGLTEISDSLFLGCKSLRDVNIPDSVQRIGRCAFYGCTSFRTIVVPHSVQDLSEAVFDSCTWLTSVTLPEGLKEIPFSLFNKCKSLTSITIPESVKEIQENAFNGCDSLSSIEIPSNVGKIGKGAFRRCPNLKQVVLSKRTKFHASAFDSTDILHYRD